ncbi:MAG: hypothetical protein RI556_05600 [Hydrogenovibrio sp.]|uniref:hypothetical protein n=1 Tax=Hydrogenovibrio TaxID=28884 RepID=UPI000361B006|nr:MULTISPECIES: hypothetical protein [Hydrogenovibrio]MDR9498629.1 hypothetical protein [Hydrogenovibrio sp.]
MQTLFEWPELSALASPPESGQLLNLLRQYQTALQPSLMQDLSHISHFAQFDGGLTLLEVTSLGQDRFKLRYQYDWALNWNCAGETGSGTVTESMRFRCVSGSLALLPLKLD